MEHYEYALIDDNGEPVFIIPGDEEKAESLAHYFAQSKNANVKRRRVGEWEDMNNA